MHNEDLLAHLRDSMNGAAPAGRDFAVCAERICFRALRQFAGGLIVRRGILEDVAQESLMRAWANRRFCRGQTSSEVAGWIAAIARCAAVDALRGDGPERLEFTDATLALGGDDACIQSSDETASQLAELAWSLGPDANEVLWWRVIAGESWESIGDRLGVSWTAARRRYQRAVARLRVLALSPPNQTLAADLGRRIARQSSISGDGNEQAGEDPPDADIG